jgi:hypothetical protein
LARAIYDLAASVKVNKQGSKFRQPSVSKMNAELVVERRTAFEREVEVNRAMAKSNDLKDADEEGTAES